MSIFRNRQLLALALGHLGVDMYPNILPMMYPLLVVSLGLSYTKIGLLQLLYTLVSSLTQPFFGYLADRHGGRYFAVGGVLTIGVFMGLLGFAWDYYSLLAMLCFGALGIAAFHPQGAMNVSAVTSSDQRALGMSIFMLGGSIGFATGPVLGAALLASPWGLHSTALLPIPGVLIALWLSRLMVKVDQVKRATAADRVRAARAAAMPRRAVVALVAVIFVVMLRSWSYLSLTNFLPLWYHDRGLPVELARDVLFVMLMATAIGGLIGGYLADRFGRRRVVAISLFLAGPTLLIFLLGAGGWLFPISIVMGLIFGSSYAVTLVMAQELLPRGIGVASGLVLGLAFVTGGIGVAVTGWIADSFSLDVGLQSLVLLPVLAGVLCLWLPTARRPAAAVAL